MHLRARDCFRMLLMGSLRRVALVWGTRGPEFKSRRSDQNCPKPPTLWSGKTGPSFWVDATFAQSFSGEPSADRTGSVDATVALDEGQGVQEIGNLLGIRASKANGRVALDRRWLVRLPVVDCPSASVRANVIAHDAHDGRVLGTNVERLTHVSAHNESRPDRPRG